MPPPPARVPGACTRHLDARRVADVTLFSSPYQAPAQPRASPSLDTPIGDVIDDPDAWAALPILLRHVPAFTGADGREHMPLREMVAFQPNSAELLRAVEAALAGLGREALQRGD